jgi:hypothetical protein
VVVNGRAAGPIGMTAARVCRTLWLRHRVQDGPGDETEDPESVTQAAIGAEIIRHTTTARGSGTDCEASDSADPRRQFPERGLAIYNSRIIEYYGPIGYPRHVTFRYEQIAG